MWWWNGYGSMPWAFGPLVGLVFMLLCMGMMWFMMRGMHDPHSRSGDALSILQERFARGEISEDEYWRLRHTLES
jgi:putative membrane protein